MTKNKAGSFFARIGKAVFKWRIEREIYEKIFFQLRQEKDFGYPFDSDQELAQETEELEAQKLLDSIEEHVSKMPAAYGAAFRYILHRDLNEHLRMYDQLAARRISRTCDPRLVATRLEA